ncbi:glutathione transferase GstA, partial [Enterobacter hormaechei]
RAVKLNMEGLDHVASYMTRVAERPAVAAALKAEGLN